MRIMVVIAAALAAFATSQAKADWEFTRWGMTPEQVAGASKGTVKVLPPSKRKTIPEIHMQSAAEGSYADGPLRLFLKFSFDTRSNGLICVGSTATGMSQNVLLRTSMIKKHGPPQKKEGLAVIGYQVFIWNKSDVIRLEMTEGALSYATHCKPGS